MATDWFVRPDGNNNNPGISPTITSAFATLTKAFSVVGKGDRIIVAPGTYNEAVAPTAASKIEEPISIIGDPNCLLFIDMTPGEVVWSCPSATHFTGASNQKEIIFEDIKFDATVTKGSPYIKGYTSAGAGGFTLRRCKIVNLGTSIGFSSVGGGVVLEDCTISDSDAASEAGAWNGTYGTSLFRLKSCLLNNLAYWVNGGGFGAMTIQDSLINSKSGATRSQLITANKVMIASDSTFSGAKLLLSNSNVKAGLFRTHHKGDTPLEVHSSAVLFVSEIFWQGFSTSHIDAGTLNGSFEDIGTKSKYVRNGCRNLGWAIDDITKVISGSKSLFIPKSGTATALLCRFQARKGRHYIIELKLRKNYGDEAYSNYSIVVGGDPYSLATFYDLSAAEITNSTSVMEITIPYTALYSGPTPIELWFYGSDQATVQEIYVDDVVIAQTA
jgi:hypothetical protein